MSKIEKNRTLYPHPFSKGYWRDAASELTSTRTLVITALLIALRVVGKQFTIMLAPPALRIGLVAPFVNALGAMIYGPVIALPAGLISDFLGYLLDASGGVYFLPYAVQEMASSFVFALFFYRQKITVPRVVLARFCVDLFVNIGIGSWAGILYYQFYMSTSYTALIIPAMIKNLCLFPLYSTLLTLLMAVFVPLTYKLDLTFDNSAGKDSLRFGKRSVVLTLILFCVTGASVFGYMFYHFNNTSFSGSYTAQERYETNNLCRSIVESQDDALADDTTVAIVTSDIRPFMKDSKTYQVTVYSADEEALAGYTLREKRAKTYGSFGETIEQIRAMSNTPAKEVAQDGVMEKVGTYTIVVNKTTGEMISCTAN